MINLLLEDGRKIQFRPESQEVDTHILPNDKIEVVSVQFDDFKNSYAPTSGPDFILWSKHHQDTIYVIEYKSGNYRFPINQLTSDKISRALRNSPVANIHEGATIRPQLWALERNRQILTVHDIDDRGQSIRQTRFLLDDIATGEDTELNSDAIVDKQKSVSTDSIKRRVEDWETRIATLYSRVGNWALEINSSFSTDTNQKVLMNEELMRRYAIAPRTLPVLCLQRGGQTIMTLKPYGLWTIGGNGRIDLYGRYINGFVIDRSEPFSPSDWEFYGNSEKKISGYKIRDGVKFNREALASIVSA